MKSRHLLVPSNKFSLEASELINSLPSLSFPFHLLSFSAIRDWFMTTDFEAQTLSPNSELSLVSCYYWTFVMLTHQWKLLHKKTLGGQHSTMVFRPRWPRFDSQHPKQISEEKIVVVAEANQHLCSEESGLLHVNDDWTHLLLAWGKLVLKKTYQISTCIFSHCIGRQSAFLTV